MNWLISQKQKIYDYAKAVDINDEGVLKEAALLTEKIQLMDKKNCGMI